MDRALIAICALLLNALLGGPAHFHQATGLSRLQSLPARLLRELERKLNRDQRSADEREMRGVVLAAAAIAAGLVAGFVCAWLLGHFELVELVLVAFLLPIRPLWDRTAQIRKALAAGDIARARQALEGTVWRNHALLDEAGLARAAIESAAVGFSEKVLAPALIYVLFGLPGLFVCKLLSLGQETLSQPIATAETFGRAAIRMHEVVQYIPSRISALLWAVASGFMPSADIEKSLRALGGIVVMHPQALVVKTGASSPYAGGRWLSDGNAKATALDAGRALYALLLLSLFLFIGLGLMM
jgi:adenosylcobinamide-phosphate synthase